MCLVPSTFYMSLVAVVGAPVPNESPSRLEVEDSGRHRPTLGERRYDSIVYLWFGPQVTPSTGLGVRQNVWRLWAPNLRRRVFVWLTIFCIVRLDRPQKEGAATLVRTNFFVIHRPPGASQWSTCTTRTPRLSFVIIGKRLLTNFKE